MRTSAHRAIADAHLFFFLLTASKIISATLTVGYGDRKLSPSGDAIICEQMGRFERERAEEEGEKGQSAARRLLFGSIIISMGFRFSNFESRDAFENFPGPLNFKSFENVLTCYVLCRVKTLNTVILDIMLSKMLLCLSDLFSLVTIIYGKLFKQSELKIKERIDTVRNEQLLQQ